MKKTQFKTDIHQIFLLTKRNFSDWDKNPRIWMTFALGFVLCLMLTNQILEQAQTFQTPVQMFEPLIWTFGDAQSVMLSSFTAVIICRYAFCKSDDALLADPDKAKRMDGKSDPICVSCLLALYSLPLPDRTSNCKSLGLRWKCMEPDCCKHWIWK